MSTLSEGRLTGPGGSVAWRLTGPAALTQAPATIRAEWEAEVQPGIQQLGRQIRSEAQTLYQGARFAAEFGYRTQIRPRAEVLLFNRNPIAGYVDDGTEAHVIRARNAPYLVFRVGGHWVRVKSVNHPGFRGKHLLPALMAKHAASFKQIAIDGMTRVLTRG